MLGGRFSLISQIGKGGGGTLYLARDKQLTTLWAVKEIPVSRKNEALILQKLQHPAIPRMVDYCEEKGACFLVMEYIQGQSLDTLLKEGKTLRGKQLKSLVTTIASILAYLHSQHPPIIYGDLKPANIMAADNGTLYLVDLGSAIVWNGRDPAKVEGTKGYAAPEQYRGHIYPQSDFYALGKTILALSGGRPGLPLRIICHKCLQKRPERRYQRAEEILTTLSLLQKAKNLLPFLVLLPLLLLPRLPAFHAPASPPYQKVLEASPSPAPSKAPVRPPAISPTYAPSPTPSPAPTPTFTPSPTPTPTPSPTPAPSPSPTPTQGPTSTPTPLPIQDQLTNLLKENVWEAAAGSSEEDTLTLSPEALKALLKSLKALRRQTKDSEEKIELTLRMAGLQELCGRPAAAQKTLEKAIESYPKQERLYSALGTLLLREGKQMESKTLFTQYLSSQRSEDKEHLPSREERIWELSLTS